MPFPESLAVRNLMQLGLCQREVAPSRLEGRREGQAIVAARWMVEHCVHGFLQQKNTFFKSLPLNAYATGLLGLSFPVKGGNHEEQRLPYLPFLQAVLTLHSLHSVPF